MYVVSLSVLHQLALGPVVTESSPLEPRPEERGAYTRAKLEAESIVSAAVREQGLQAVIVRPGLIWSEEVLLPASVGMRAGGRLVMIGDRNLRLPLIHVDDVVSAMILAMNNDVPAGEIFHLVDYDPLAREELAKLYLADVSRNFAWCMYRWRSHDGRRHTEWRYPLAHTVAQSFPIPASLRRCTFELRLHQG